uniref:Uncharacterized protein n=1 Tax=Moniliophthora roreri TaxID=221103 RepID=A0A0W0G020_MONRR
MAYQGFPQSR